jgi:hypothetical protein
VRCVVDGWMDGWIGEREEFTINGIHDGFMAGRHTEVLRLGIHRLVTAFASGSVIQNPCFLLSSLSSLPHLQKKFRYRVCNFIVVNHTARLNYFSILYICSIPQLPTLPSLTSYYSSTTQPAPAHLILKPETPPDYSPTHTPIVAIHLWRKRREGEARDAVQQLAGDVLREGVHDISLHGLRPDGDPAAAGRDADVGEGPAGVGAYTVQTEMARPAGMRRAPGIRS